MRITFNLMIKFISMYNKIFINLNLFLIFYLKLVYFFNFLKHNENNINYFKIEY